MASGARAGLILLFAALVRSAATNPDLCPFGYLGCYTNGVLQDNYSDQVDGDFTMEKCLNICYGQGYNYGGATDGNQCWCADDLIDASSETTQDQCNMPCTGNSDELCGGATAQSVYQLSPEPDSCLASDGGDDGGNSATTIASTSVTTTDAASITSETSSVGARSTSTIISATPLYPISNTTSLFPGTGSPTSTTLGATGASPASTTTNGNSSSASAGASSSANAGGQSQSLGQSTSQSAGAGTSSATTSVSNAAGNRSGTASDQSTTVAASITTGSESGTGTQASTSSPTVAPPAPTASGTTTACYQYYVVPQGGTCYSIQQRFGIDFDTLQGLNPSLNAACSNLMAGYAYCVSGVTAARVGSYSASSMSSTSKPNVSTVSTVSPGQTIPAGQTGYRSSFTSNGSVCRYMTYTMNVNGMTIGTMSS